MTSIANYADETAIQKNMTDVKGDKKPGPVTGGALNLRGSKRGSLVVLPKHNPGAGISGGDGAARPMRIGFAPPEAAGNLREQLPKEICGACGVPPEMLLAGAVKPSGRLGAFSGCGRNRGRIESLPICPKH